MKKMLGEAIAIRKFDSTAHARLLETMPFSYVSTAVYADYCAYVLHVNGEDLVVTEDPLFRHDFPSLFLPKNEDNWEYLSASMVREEEIERVKRANIEIAATNPTETEFIYATQSFLKPKNSMKTKISQFQKKYTYTVLHSYDHKRIRTFEQHWKQQKGEFSNVYQRESASFFSFCLDHLDIYGIEQIYIEIEEQLAGFVWGVRHQNNGWIGLHSKVDYRYRGLDRYMKYAMANIFSDTKRVSLGTGCNDEGLTQYKEELGPSERIAHHYLLTRGKKTS